MGFDGREYSQLTRIIGSNECSTHLSGNRDLNIPKISTLWIYILMKYLLKVKQVNWRGVGHNSRHAWNLRGLCPGFERMTTKKEGCVMPTWKIAILFLAWRSWWNNVFFFAKLHFNDRLTSLLHERTHIECVDDSPPIISHMRSSLSNHHNASTLYDPCHPCDEGMAGRTISNAAI